MLQLIRRVIAALGALMALAVYIWFAAVRNAPEIRRRKALRRR
jgi:hypothetical protein